MFLRMHHRQPCNDDGPCSTFAKTLLVTRLLTAGLIAAVISKLSLVTDAQKNLVVPDPSMFSKYEGTNVCYFLNAPKHPSERGLYLMSVIDRTWRRVLGPRDFFYKVIEGNETGFVDNSTETISIKMHSIGYDKLHFKLLKLFRFASMSPTALGHCDFALTVETDSYVNPRALRHVILRHVDAKSFLWTGSIWGSHCGSFAHSSVLVSRGFLERSKLFWQPCLTEMRTYGNYSTWGDVAFSCCMQKFGLKERLNQTPGFVDHNNWEAIDDIGSIQDPECVVLAHKVNFTSRKTIEVLNTKNMSNCRSIAVQ